MRIHRITLFAGWIIVSMLAVAGFAAFSASDESPTVSAPSSVSISSDLGRAAGSVSALAFAYLADGASTTTTAPDLDQAVQRAIENRVNAFVPTSTTLAQATIRSDSVIIRSRFMSESDVRDLVSRYFQPEDVNRAVRMAWCESTFNPAAVNPVTGAAGLFQHLPGYWGERSTAAGWPGADILDPEANVAVAAWLLYEVPGGWSHWECTA